MATFTQLTGNAVITGTAGADLITTGAGNDCISAGAGVNTVRAGEGNNSITAGSGDDNITAGAGNDGINAGDGSNTIDAGGGNNTVYSGSGNDDITTGSGNDTISAGAGNNRIRAGAGINTISTGSGNDDITTGAGNDYINAGGGTNIVNAGDGVNTISAGSGNDTVTAGAGNDSINAGDGNNSVNAGDGINNIVTGIGNDTIISGSGNDVINAGGGNNIVNAGDGNNVVTAGIGNDAINSGAGNDTINAGDGTNTVISGAGNDRITTGSGTDTVDAGRGNDVVNSGGGNDVILHRIAENVGSIDQYDGSSGQDTLRLDLSSAEWTRSDVQADVAAFLARANPAASFRFNSTKLTVVNIERLEVFVEGVQLTNPANEAVSAVADSIIVTEDTPASSLNLLLNDNVPDRAASVTLLGTSTLGTATLVTSLAGAVQTATLSFTPSPGLQRLAQGQSVSETLQYRVQDINGDFSIANVKITITGTNDLPVITAEDLAGAITELGSPTGTLRDSGTVSFSDVDLSDVHLVSAIGTPVGSTLGSLSAIKDSDTTGSGTGGQLTWTYSVAASAVEFLASGQTRLESFTLTLSDGNGGVITKQVDVTITGTNDAPTISVGTQAVGALAEDAAATLTAAGTIAFDDVDLSDAHTVNVVAGVGNQLVGALVLGAVTESPSTAGGTVGWTYSVANSAVQYLASGQTQTETFVVTVADGQGGSVQQTVSVTISGTNDAPTIAAGTQALGSLAEDAAATLSAIGTIAFTDVDLIDVHTVSAVAGAGNKLTGTLSFGMVAQSAATEGGSVGWTYSLPSSAVQYLAEGEVQIETYVVSVDDGQGGNVQQTVAVTITGTNDAPVVTGVVTGRAAEDGAVSTLSALANASDIDTGATLSVVNLPTTLPAGVTYDATSKSFTLDPSNAAFQSLARDATTTVTVSYGVSDGMATTQATASWTVTGTNDGPLATAGLIATNQGRSISGTLGASDADLADSTTFSLLDGPSHGTLDLTAAGGYRYTPANGYSGSDSFTYRVSDSLGVASDAAVQIEVAKAGGPAQVRYVGSDGFVSAGSVNVSGPPVVAALAGGGHVVVWDAETGRFPNGSPGTGVFQQRYDAEGVKIGQPELVSSPGYDPFGNLTFGTWGNVAAAGDGWVVTFSLGAYGGLFEQRYDADGKKVGDAPVRLSGSDARTQFSSVAGALDGGGHVVVWTGTSANGTLDILTRVVDANGVPQGTPFVVNASTDGNQSLQTPIGSVPGTQSVVGLDGGGFVVTWLEPANAEDGSGSAVMLRVFGADLQPLTPNDVLVNATTTGDQQRISVGAVGSGFVATWTSPGQDGSGTGVYAQRFNANGGKVGDEFRVNTWTQGDQAASKVIELKDGGFVILWHSDGAGGTAGRQIAGQRYDADGHAVSGEFIVDLELDFGQNDSYPSVALREDGALVVAWLGNAAIEQKVIENFAADTTSLDQPVSDPILRNYDPPEVAALRGLNAGHVVVWSAVNGPTADGSTDPGYGVYQQRYDGAGQKLGGPQHVNATVAGNQYMASVAAVGSGWVVTWNSQDDPVRSDSWYVHQQRYGANGSPIGSETQVNETGTFGVYPEANVGELADGGYVVSWSGYRGNGNDFEIFARLYNADGSERTGQFVVNATSLGNQSTLGSVTESVIGLKSGGFVVAWNDPKALGTTSPGQVVKVFDAQGQAVSADILVVSTTPANNQISTSVGAVDAGFVATWSSFQQDGSGWGVYAQRFAADGSKLDGEFRVNTWTQGDQIYSKVVGLDDGGFVVAWQSAGAGGATVNQISGQRYARNGDAVGGEFTINNLPVGSNTIPSMALRSDGALIVAWYDGAGQRIEQTIVEDIARDTTPVNVATDELVSGSLLRNFFPPEVTSLTDGGHVVVWAAFAGPGGDSYDVYQQRYDAAGVAMSGPQLVNAATAGDQYAPSAAAAGDGWVVTWTSSAPFTGRRTVYQQQYDEDGQPMGPARASSDIISVDQQENGVGELADGGYVVSWTESGNIRAKMFNADGTTRAETIDVSPGNPEATQTENIAGLKGGGFVVVWRGGDAAGRDGDGVLMKVFGSNGEAVTAALLVNTTVANTQFYASVSAVGNGFVVTWSSQGQDGSDFGIFAQRFDAAGHPLGGEFQVNQWSYDRQIQSKVVALNDGGFVIAWVSRGAGDLGVDMNQISGQRFDSDGKAVGTEFVINNQFGAYHESPSMTVRSDGALVVVWQNSSAGPTIEQKIITSLDAGSVDTKTLAGGLGNDAFIGSDLVDTLSGAGGNDRLDGLGGDDLLTGGAGADTFVFSTDPGIGNVEQIADFVSGTDHFEFVASGDYASLTAGPLSAASLDILGDASAATAATRVIYDPATGALYFDPDGNGGAAAVQVATLTNTPATLTPDDFTVTPA